jgi:hypothetical protein
MPKLTREEMIGRGKVPVATQLSSRQIRDRWDARLKEEAVFSARTTSKSYIDAVKKRLVEVIGGTLSPQEAERRLRETLRDLGYTPAGGFGDNRVPAAKAGDIRDLSSSRRIQLVIDTNVKRARSMGQVAASEDPVLLMATPAWKLTRTGARKKPRGNWLRRWAEAGAACGWKGALKKQMVALKTSPIWEKLGEGAGGFDDCIGSPYPPFAFGSGMAWVSVGRREWKRMCGAEGVDDGLDGITEKARELKAGKGAVPTAPLKVDLEAPRGLGIVQGVGNPLAASPTPVPAAYAPNYAARDAANAAIDDALDVLDGYADEIAGWTARAVKADLPATADELRRIGVEMASLRGRVVNYGSSVDTQPIPRSRMEQSGYDMAMDRYARSATATARGAENVRDEAAEVARALPPMD